MPPAHHLSLLALQQLLAGTDGGKKVAAAAALAARCAGGDAALLAALPRAEKLAWSALEIVVAGESFWEGCAVFLAPAEHAAFRRQVDWLRAHTPLAAGDRADGLRRQCAKELQASRPGQRTPDGGALAEALRSGAPAGLEDFKRAGCPGVAEAFLHPARDGTPALLPAALGHFARRELSAAPELTAGLPALPQEQAAALDRVGEVLVAHGRGLQEWLTDDGDTPRPAAATASPNETQTAAENDRLRRPRLGAWLLTLTVLLLPLLLMVWLIQRYTVEPARRLEGHTDAVTGVTFLPGGGHIVSASLDRTVRFWDADTGKEVGRLDGPTTGRARVTAAPDGKRLLVADDTGVRLYDAASRKELKGLNLPAGTTVAATFTPAGPRALTAGAGPRRLQLWDLDTGKRLQDLDLEQDTVQSLALSADGRRAASVGRRLVVWDLDAGKRLHALEGEAAPVTAVALSADGGRLATGSMDGTLRVWDAAAGKELQTIKGPANAVIALAFSADGRMILSGGSGLRGDRATKEVRAADDPRTLRLWEAATGRDLALFSGPEGAVWAVAFAPDGKAALSAGADKVIRLWKLP